MARKRKGKKPVAPRVFPVGMAAFVTPDVRAMSEQGAALHYTEKWHHVRDWALEACAQFGDVGEETARFDKRVSVANGIRIRSRDVEEIRRYSYRLESLSFDNGPNMKVGGERRVMISAFTWVVRDNDPIGASNPRWIIIGSGLTARECTNEANNYIDSYANAVEHHDESLRLIVSEIAVKWWTAPSETDYV